MPITSMRAVLLRLMFARLKDRGVGVQPGRDGACPGARTLTKYLRSEIERRQREMRQSNSPKSADRSGATGDPLLPGG